MFSDGSAVQQYLRQIGQEGSASEKVADSLKMQIKVCGEQEMEAICTACL